MVQRGVDRRDVVDDRRALRGVFDLQIADDVDQQFQFAAAVRDVGFDFFGFADFLQACNTGLHRLHPLLVGFQGLLTQQELYAVPRHPLRLRFDVFLQHVDRGVVGVAQSAQ